MTLNRIARSYRTLNIFTLAVLGPAAVLLWLPGGSDWIVRAIPSGRAVALRAEPVPVSPASPLSSLSQGVSR